MRASSRQFRLATEMIDFQKDTFGKDLEQLFTEFCDWLDQNYLTITGEKAQKSGFPERIEALIFKRTGIAVTLMVNTQELAAIMPLWSNKQHIFLDAVWHNNLDIKDQEHWTRSAAGKKGTVDLKNARVGGVFSTYKHGLWLNIVDAYHFLKFTPAELTAAVLHEMGHAFTTFEFSDRLETTNQVMQNLSQTIKRTGDQEERTYFFETLGETLCQDKSRFAEFISAKASFFSNLAVVKRVFEEIQSQQTYGKYNETSGEQVADQFVARFGYGKPLITGLHKLHRLVDGPETMRFLRIVYNFYQIASLFITIMGFTPSGFSLLLLAPELLLGHFIVSVIVILALFGSAEQNADYKYDTLKTRYARIRHQYIELLQQSQLDRTEIKATLETIYAMDKVIAETVEFRSVFQLIANIFFLKSRAILKDVRLQKLVEELAHNTLFIKAAELKTLS